MKIEQVQKQHSTNWQVSYTYLRSGYVKFTEELLKLAEQEVYDIDRYGRTVGVVYIDGTNVNQEILRAGYAQHYRRYCKTAFCSDWIELEEVATAAKMGLWADPKAMPPWEWRRVKNNQSTWEDPHRNFIEKTRGG